VKESSWADSGWVEESQDYRTRHWLIPGHVVRAVVGVAGDVVGLYWSVGHNGYRHSSFNHHQSSIELALQEAEAYALSLRLTLQTSE